VSVKQKKMFWLCRNRQGQLTDVRVKVSRYLLNRKKVKKRRLSRNLVMHKKDVLKSEQEGI
jgi:hypothetical protein